MSFEAVVGEDCDDRQPDHDDHGGAADLGDCVERPPGRGVGLGVLGVAALMGDRPADPADTDQDHKQAEPQAANGMQVQLSLSMRGPFGRDLD